MSIFFCKFAAKFAIMRKQVGLSLPVYIGRGKSGQHIAPQRLTAVRQQCLVTATETSRFR